MPAEIPRKIGQLTFTVDVYESQGKDIRTAEYLTLLDPRLTQHDLTEDALALLSRQNYLNVTSIQELAKVAANDSKRLSAVKAFVPDSDEAMLGLRDSIIDLLAQNQIFQGSPAMNTSRYELADDISSRVQFAYEQLNPTQLTEKQLDELPENSYIFNIWAESFVQVFVKTQYSDIHGKREVSWYNIQGDPEVPELYTSKELGRYRQGETPFTLLVQGSL